MLGQQNDSRGYNRSGVACPAAGWSNLFQKATLYSWRSPCTLRGVGSGVFRHADRLRQRRQSSSGAWSTAARSEFALRAALGAARSRVARQLLSSKPSSSPLSAQSSASQWPLVHCGALIALSPPGGGGAPRHGHRPGCTVLRPGHRCTGRRYPWPRSGLSAFCAKTFKFTPAGGGRRAMQHPPAPSAERDVRTLVVSEISTCRRSPCRHQLCGRSMQHIFAVDPGRFSTPPTCCRPCRYNVGSTFRYRRRPRPLLRRRARSARHLPGVVSAGFTTQLPLSGDGDVYGMELQGRDRSAADTCSALKLPLLATSKPCPSCCCAVACSTTTTSPARPEPVLTKSEGALPISTPHQEPIGHLVYVGPDAGRIARPLATIAGVLGDAAQTSSSSIGGEYASSRIIDLARTLDLTLPKRHGPHG